MIVTGKAYTVKNTNIKIEISSRTLKEVNKMKYLGVVIDNKISMPQYAHSILSEMLQKQRLFYRIGKYLYIKGCFCCIRLPHFRCRSMLHGLSAYQIKKLF